MRAARFDQFLDEAQELDAAAEKFFLQLRRKRTPAHERRQARRQPQRQPEGKQCDDQSQHRADAGNGNGHDERQAQQHHHQVKSAALGAFEQLVDRELAAA